MNIKKITLITFIFFFLPSNIFANSEIRYLDLKLIMNNSNAGKNILKKLNKENTINNNFFKKNEEIFKNDEQRLVKQKNIINKIDFENQLRILEKKIKQYNIIKNNKIKSLSEKRIKARSELYKVINPILVKYSEKNNISMIFKKENLIIGKSNSDITQDILKEINNQISKIDIN
tara:strand:+ start:1701 stop:2225 length:525 start_codon:yes stop_codon:yes gene_type:complete